MKWKLLPEEERNMIMKLDAACNNKWISIDEYTMEEKLNLFVFESNRAIIFNFTMVICLENAASVTERK
jgi:hypothetical protein